MNYPERWKQIVYDRSMFVKDKLVKPPKTSNKSAVILEFRNDMFLLHVIRVFLYHLAPQGFAFHLYYGLDNEALVKTFIAPLGVQIHRMRNHNVYSWQYSSFLMTRQFWEIMPSETILIFETDAFIRKSTLGRYLGFDFIGAPWCPVLAPWSKSRSRVGNGGFSIRKKSAMLRCIAQRQNTEKFSDDRFFGETCEDLLYLPATDVARSFSVETWEHPDPVGFHKPWLYLNEEQMERIYELMLNPSS